MTTPLAGANVKPNIACPVATYTLLCRGARPSAGNPSGVSGRIPVHADPPSPPCQSLTYDATDRFIVDSRRGSRPSFTPESSIIPAILTSRRKGVSATFASVRYSGRRKAGARVGMQPCDRTQASDAPRVARISVASVPSEPAGSNSGLFTPLTARTSVTTTRYKAKAKPTPKNQA